MMNYEPNCNQFEPDWNGAACAVHPSLAYGYPTPADGVCVLDWVPSPWNPWARNTRR